MSQEKSKKRTSKNSNSTSDKGFTKQEEKEKKEPTRVSLNKISDFGKYLKKSFIEKKYDSNQSGAHQTQLVEDLDYEFRIPDELPQALKLMQLMQE